MEKEPILYRCMVYPVSEEKIRSIPVLEKIGGSIACMGRIVDSLLSDSSGSIMKDKKIPRSEFLEISRRLSSLVQDVLHSGNLPLIIGGDNTLLLGLTAGIRRVSFLNSLVFISPVMGLALTGKKKSLDEAVIAHLVGEGDRNIYAFSSISPLMDGNKVILCGWTKALRMEKHLSISLGIFNWSLREMRENGISGIAGKISDTALIGANLVNIHLDCRLLDFESIDENKENKQKIDLAELCEFVKPFKKAGIRIIWSFAHLEGEQDSLTNNIDMILNLIMN